MIKINRMTPNAANILLKALSEIRLSSKKRIPSGTVYMKDIDLEIWDGFDDVQAFRRASEEIKTLMFWYESHAKYQLVKYFFINGEGLSTYCTYYLHQYVYEELEAVKRCGDLKPYLKHLGNNLC
jgi:hypothetical protein